jgi:hypothetical protein
VHETAQQVAPGSRVVYVDTDPVVWSHGQALLAYGDQVAMVRADLREPATVLRHPDVLGLLDLTRPVAVVCASVLRCVVRVGQRHSALRCRTSEIPRSAWPAESQPLRRR